MNIKSFEFDQNTSIKSLLKEINHGSIKLPYFQRDFVWGLKEMKSLVSSIIVGLPIGSILFLMTEASEFATREIEGITNNTKHDKNNIKFLLDGQQRSTALYSIFTNNISNIKKGKLARRWFLDLELFALDTDDPLSFSNLDNFEPEDIEDYIIPIDRIDKNKNYFIYQQDENFNTIFIDQICREQKLFPLDLLFFTDENSKSANTRINIILSEIKSKLLSILPSEYKNQYEESELDNKADLWRDGVRDYLTSLLDIKIPTIKFETRHFNRAIQAFEILNKSGVKLHLFDLLVARAGRNKGDDNSVQNFYNTVFQEYSTDLIISEKKFSLSNWNFTNLGEDDNKLSVLLKDQIVNLLTVLISYKVSKGEKIKLSKNYLFEMTVRDSIKYLNETIKDVMVRLKRAYFFLQATCGIRTLNDISYKLIVLPIAFVLDDKTWGNPSKLKLIEAWYWTTIFSGIYEYNQNEVTLKQLKIIKQIIKNPSLLSTTDVLNQTKPVDADDNYIGITTYDALKHCTSGSLHNTILQFILSRKPLDFLKDDNGQEHKLSALDDNILEIHHILPLDTQKQIGESTKELRKLKDNPYNSILNKTYISKFSNQKIRSMIFEKYKKSISDTALANHCIYFTNEHNIEKFLQNRYDSLKAKILEHISTLVDK